MLPKPCFPLQFLRKQRLPTPAARRSHLESILVSRVNSLFVDQSSKRAALSLQRAISFLFLVLILSSSAKAAEFIPLGTLPGYSDSAPFGVSDDGTVVAGWGTRGGYWQVFRWTDSTGPISLGTLPGDTTTVIEGYGFQCLSADGSSIVGGSGEQPSGPTGPYRSSEAFLYRADSGMVSLGVSTDRATGVSHDGSAVIGWSGDYSTPTAFRWTQLDGATPLNLLPSYTWSVPSDVTRDGTVVVGLTGLEDRSDATAEIFRWTADEGMSGTGLFIADTGSPVPHVSDDGSVIAASTNVTSLANTEAFYWTQATGLVGLGWLPPPNGSMVGIHSTVRDMTPDGRVIVGWSGELNGPQDVKPFVWTEAGGMEDFQQVLMDRHGLGSALEGWNLISINAVSSNGQFFAGYARDITGDRAAWLVRLDAPWGTLTCDFDSNSQCNIDDFNQLLNLGPVATGVSAAGNEEFDLNGDGVIDNADVDQWLSVAATENGFASPYFRGDANLDGSVDVSDFNIWNSHRLSFSLAWDSGDFNGDGAVDASDFNIWNSHRLMSSARTPATVPEPEALWLSFIALGWLAALRRLR